MQDTSDQSVPSNSPSDKNFDAELEYTFSFFPFLAPDSLALNCILQGIRPSVELAVKGRKAEGLTYCELGCGQGVTLNILAAGDESGRYFGIDYNPAQIENARSLAEDAGLDNVQFIEASFADLKQLDLPDFDVVALHGIYSWISPALRRDIVQFLKRKLKPGGICFISYNCTISRGSELAFRQLLQTVISREAHPSPEAISKSLAFAQALADNGAQYFKMNAGTMEELKVLKKRNPVYAFHEYFNPIWTPFFFHEVAAELADCDLTYAGMTDLAWNYVDLAVPNALRAMFKDFPSSNEQELLKGLWTNQSFRRDIYIKGSPVRLSLDQQIETLKALHYGLSRNREDCQLNIKVPAGTIALPAEPLTSLLDTLQKSPVSGATLRQLLPSGPIGDRDFVRTLVVLFAAQYAERRTAPSLLAGIKRRFDRLNAAIGRCADKSQDIFIITTPENRLAINLSATNYYLCRAHLSGASNRASEALELLMASGRSVSYKGQEIKDRKMAEAVIMARDRSFVSKILPRL